MQTKTVKQIPTVMRTKVERLRIGFPETRKRPLIIWVVICFCLSVSTGSAATEEIHCLDNNSTEILQEWAQTLLKQPEMASFNDVDLKIDRQSATLVFKQPTTAQNLICHLHSSKASPARPESIVMGPYLLDFTGGSPAEHHSFLEVVHRHPPPNVWETRHSPGRLNPRFSTARLWTWLFLPILLLPILLLTVWLFKWWRTLPQHPSDPAVWLALAMAAPILIFHQIAALTEQQIFDNDASRDFINALVLARGLEFPFFGPAISNLHIHLGPLYSGLIAALMGLSETPQTFFFIVSASQLATLFLGTQFLKRNVGQGAAILFSFLFVLHAYTIQKVSVFSHNYLAFPTVLLLGWILVELNENRRFKYLPLAALLYGIALQFYTVFIFLFPPIAFLLYGLRKSIPRSKWLLALLMFILPGLFTFGTTIANSLSELDVLGSFSTTLEGFGDLGFHHYCSILFDLINQWYAVPDRFGMYLILTGITASALFTIRPFPDDPSIKRHVRLALFGSLLFLFLLGAILSSYVLWRYLAVFIPVLPLLAAIGLADALHAVFGRHFHLKKWQSTLAVALAGVAICVAVWWHFPYPVADTRYKGLDLRHMLTLAEDLNAHGFENSDQIKTHLHGLPMHFSETNLHSFLPLFEDHSSIGGRPDPPEQTTRNGLSQPQLPEVWIGYPPASAAPNTFSPNSNDRPTLRYYNESIDWTDARFVLGTQTMNRMDLENEGIQIARRGTEITPLYWLLVQVRSQDSTIIPIEMDVENSHRLSLVMPLPATGNLLRLLTDANCEFQISVDGKVLSTDHLQTVKNPLDRSLQQVTFTPTRGQELTIDFNDETCPLNNFDLFVPPSDLEDKPTISDNPQPDNVENSSAASDAIQSPP